MVSQLAIRGPAGERDRAVAKLDHLIGAGGDLRPRVGDVHGRDRVVGADAIEVRQDLRAMRLIDRRERLVEQQQPRLRQQRAAERDALFLAARTAATDAGAAAAPRLSSSMTSSASQRRLSRDAGTSGRTEDSAGRSGAETAAAPETRSRCGADAAGRHVRVAPYRPAPRRRAARRARSGRTTPAMTLSSVVLPAPDGPTSAVSPGPSSSATSSMKLADRVPDLDDEAHDSRPPERSARALRTRRARRRRSRPTATPAASRRASPPGRSS